MKKKLFKCVVTLFVLSECMFIASCTNDVVVDGNAKVENKQDVNESKLISSLESLNKDLMTEKHIARKNKPKNPGWTTKQKLQVVVADFSGAWKGGKGGVSLGSKLGLIVGQPHTGAIVGGIIGAVVCGGAASWLAAPESKPRRAKANIPLPKDSLALKYPMASSTFDKVFKDELVCRDSCLLMSSEIQKKVYVDNETLANISLNDKQLNIGKMHNIFLSVLDGSTTLKQSGMCNSNDTLYNSIINSEDMKDLYDKTIKEIQNEEYFNSDSKAEYALNLFKEVFDKYVEENKDVVYIINKYSEIINESDELDDEDKDYIMPSLATALYSYNYWNTTSDND